MKLTQELIPAMQGIVPSTMATVAANGTPNITYVSQVFYVDDEHVALSFQFMKKSWQNILDNPRFTIILTHPRNFTLWEMHLEYEKLITDGPVFMEMDMQLSAIASMFVQAAHFQLKAAVLCRVLDIKVQYDGNR